MTAIPQLLWIKREDALLYQKEALKAAGGLPGVRDMGLLEAALNRPRQHFHYEPDVSFCFLAALYTQAVAKNHPFVDANKRAALMIGEGFLNGHGIFLKMSSRQSVLTEAVLALAQDGHLQDYEKLLRKNVTVLDVAFLPIKL
ncbi:type II toxin-antitoxin system death-on-curing family toxin [Formicincola oecophyllae]|uniref:Type II toxin-antitoxin system death-on-curing family toxin n=1 Tax=Formicincola oecophyllae TaxID=2558361 RepID=A0A4Y6UA57_9PROT|nr:Fic family protein [Formicincola oecophyllae]QDH14094.1 type II toxin-antitoxin system death-on-curing family toxin [Formicincola oecophyllae]